MDFGSGQRIEEGCRLFHDQSWRGLSKDPPIIREIWQELMESFEQGRLRPLPREVFPIEEAVAAFRQMAQARHIGKIVLRDVSLAGKPNLRATRPSVEDASY